MMTDDVLRAFDDMPPIEARRAGETKEQFVKRVRGTQIERFIKLHERCGLPLNDLGSAYTLLSMVLPLALGGFRVAAPSGTVPLQEQSANDLILCFGVDQAKKSPDFKSVLDACAKLKKYNNWPQSASALKRRYYVLQKNLSRERQRAAVLAAELVPKLREHLDHLSSKQPK